MNSFPRFTTHKHSSTVARFERFAKMVRRRVFLSSGIDNRFTFMATFRFEVWLASSPAAGVTFFAKNLVGGVDLNDSVEPKVGELLACRCEAISSNTVNKLADTTFRLILGGVLGWVGV